MKEFEPTYKRLHNPEAIRNSGKTFSFWTEADLAKAINHAVDRSGYRFTSEFIRAAIIDKIERMISES